MNQEQLLFRHPASLRPPSRDARQSRDPEFIRALGEDIKRRGMRQPICCRAVGEELEVVTGESRRQAALFAGVNAIPVRLIKEELPPSVLLMEQLLENDLRREFTYLERTSLYAALMQANEWNQLQLAEAIGKSPGEINKVLAIKGRLPEDLIEKIQAGKLPVSVAYALSKLSDQQQMRDIGQRYETGVLCRDGVVAEVRRRQDARRPTAKPVLLKDGRFVAKIPGEWTWEQMSLLGQRLVETAKKGEKHGLPFSSLPSIYRKE